MVIHASLFDGADVFTRGLKSGPAALAFDRLVGWPAYSLRVQNDLRCALRSCECLVRREGMFRDIALRNEPELFARAEDILAPLREGPLAWKVARRFRSTAEAFLCKSFNLI
jgi:hypothetical protein